MQRLKSIRPRTLCCAIALLVALAFIPVTEHLRRRLFLVGVWQEKNGENFVVYHVDGRREFQNNARYVLSTADYRFTWQSFVYERFDPHDPREPIEENNSLVESMNWNGTQMRLREETWPKLPTGYNWKPATTWTKVEATLLSEALLHFRQFRNYYGLK